MKKLILPFFLFAFIKINAQQNEFAATRFYNAFLKIYADAEGAFPLYKGEIIRSKVKNVFDDYKIKLMLPGAESGMIRTASGGNSYAQYYFYGGTTLGNANQKRYYLKQAIEKALSKDLYEKAVMYSSDEVTFYDVKYFIYRIRIHTAAPLFETSVYREKGRYLLVFKINQRSISADANKEKKENTAVTEPGTVKKEVKESTLITGINPVKNEIKDTALIAEPDKLVKEEKKNTVITEANPVKNEIKDTALIAEPDKLVKEEKKNTVITETNPVKNEIKDTALIAEPDKLVKEEKKNTVITETNPVKKEIKDTALIAEPDKLVKEEKKSTVITETNPVKKEIKDSALKAGPDKAKREIKDSALITGSKPVNKEVKEESLTGEANLDGKIRSFWNDAAKCFSSFKGNKESTSKFVTKYQTNKTLFGMSGIVEDWKLECEIKFTISFTEQNSLDDANKIFSQLKSSLARVMVGKIYFTREEQSTYDAESYSIRGIDAGTPSPLSKNTITLSITRSKDYPVVYLWLSRKKS
jgi:hypothetical protein